MVCLIAIGCSSEKTPAVSPTPVEATSVPPTLGPGADQDIWDAVVDAVDGNMTPILRPASPPPGVVRTTSDFGKNDPRVIFVMYEGPGIALWIQAGRLNPPPPPIGGSQQDLTVRGQAATLVIANTADPTAESWLYWQEPGTLLGEDGAPVEHWLYEVRSKGLDPALLATFAESLRPYP